ncbi:MAG: DedA family protein [Candidatus Marinimicrobia bacterium]|nr:DedA family protein [Candidatus Neomarinimicrobiota bacterium]
MFEEFMNSVTEMNTAWLYGMLLLAAYMENVVPPIPGDSVVIFGAYLVGLGKIEFLPSLMITTIGSVTGFMTFYAIGRYGGREYFENKKFKWFDKERMNKVEDWIQKKGLLIILTNRFLAGTRSVVSIFAGFARLGWIKVTVLAFISSLVWNGMLITAGYYAGKNWSYVESMLQNYNIFISVIIVLAISAGVILYKRRKSAVQTSGGN